MAVFANLWTETLNHPRVIRCAARGRRRIGQAESLELLIKYDRAVLPGVRCRCGGRICVGDSFVDVETGRLDCWSCSKGDGLSVWRFLNTKPPQGLTGIDSLVQAAIGGFGRSRVMSPTLRARILERDNFRCRRCGATVDDGVRLRVDHVVPVAQGGDSRPSNLQTLCDECNQGKSDRAPHPFDLRRLADGEACS